MMEGIKEWWSPVFFSSFFFSSYFLSFLVILAASRLAPFCQSYQAWWSDTRQDWAQRARAGGVSERKMKRNNKAIISFWLTSIQLSSPPHPMSRLLFVHSFLHTFLALIRQTVYCLVICLSQFCLLSSVSMITPPPLFCLTLPYST